MLLLVYAVNFGTTVHTSFWYAQAAFEGANNTANKQSEQPTKSFDTPKAFEFFSDTPTELSHPDKLKTISKKFTSWASSEAYLVAKDVQLLTNSKLLIPSYNTRTCIFPFHSFT
ncbi:hypothetical protein ACFSQP_10780 [Bizionia sediminis]|uniref:Uncharacterized protein n=1 Tax=Bizionia sediminis TaxID=1737064 RepID=A0ABW5KTJ7_9FLAO